MPWNLQLATPRTTDNQKFALLVPIHANMLTRLMLRPNERYRTKASNPFQSLLLLKMHFSQHSRPESITSAPDADSKKNSCTAIPSSPTTHHYKRLYSTHPTPLLSSLHTPYKTTSKTPLLFISNPTLIPFPPPKSTNTLPKSLKLCIPNPSLSTLPIALSSLLQCLLTSVSSIPRSLMYLWLRSVFNLSLR